MNYSDACMSYSSEVKIHLEFGSIISAFSCENAQSEAGFSCRTIQSGRITFPERSDHLDVKLNWSGIDSEIESWMHYHFTL